ncbi:BgTH12-02725 [Blumeria graminis f. sp. triticale]|uniref:BgTH12-02725 n=1 Tax=Blumeria graminis f. sp. triticale TaxID=1689686 RepID=A0A9W4DJS6_BLUGR|nr:BgTH12-02725 [Blumeria graminis f. sp. triticale]
MSRVGVLCSSTYTALLIACLECHNLLQTDIIPCKLSYNTSRATSNFIIFVHSSFLMKLRPTTLLIAVASASLIVLQ